MTWFFIENPKDFTQKLLELIHKFNTVTVYKINVQKPVSFLYTNNGEAEREIKESVPFTIAQKYKISWNKTNQRSERPIVWKTKKRWWKKLKMTEINGNTFHDHR